MDLIHMKIGRMMKSINTIADLSPHKKGVFMYTYPSNPLTEMTPMKVVGNFSRSNVNRACRDMGGAYVVGSCVFTVKCNEYKFAKN